MVCKSSLWRRSEDDEKTISRLSSEYCDESPLIFAAIFSKKSIQDSYQQNRNETIDIPPTFAIGGRIPFPLSVGDVELGDRPFGFIATESGIRKAFNSKEMEFVLAHEYGHIALNHNPLRYLGSFYDWLVASSMSKIVDKSHFGRLLIGLKVLEPLITTQFTGQSELDADRLAQWIIGDRRVVKTSIQKLSEKYTAGDITQPCHIEIKDGIRTSLVTYQERLEAID